MRRLIRNRIITNTALTNEIPVDRWFGSGSVVDTPARPFAEIRFGGVFRAMGPVKRRRLEVWVHDEEGDYTRIDRILGLLRGVLDGAEHVFYEDVELIRSEWINDSTDLYDDKYRTNTKSAVFDVIGTGE